MAKVGRNGGETHASNKRMKISEAARMMRAGVSVERIADEIGLSVSTVETYRRELVRAGKLEPSNFRSTVQRHEFIRANINQPLEWFVAKTGLSPSTLARDMKKLGRDDIKLSSYVTGKGKVTGKNELLSREFRECARWNCVFASMTTKREVTL